MLHDVQSWWIHTRSSSRLPLFEMPFHHGRDEQQGTRNTMSWTDDSKTHKMGNSSPLPSPRGWPLIPGCFLDCLWLLVYLYGT
mmetsp:Transcript_56707/g.101113  ORF Transcript_56707/g.101113 Transcript_56707/m.101113 type:complete len:83 (+) Transcript_56707:350-598(+)